MHDQHLSADTRAVLEAIRAMDARHQRNEEVKHAENKQQIESILTAQRKLQSEVSGIARGFPDGDPESHRRYHESVMEWRELRNKMVREALIKASQVGGLAAIGWVAYALWSALKMEILR